MRWSGALLRIRLGHITCDASIRQQTTSTRDQARQLLQSEPRHSLAAPSPAVDSSSREVRKCLLRLDGEPPANDHPGSQLRHVQHRMRQERVQCNCPISCPCYCRITLLHHHTLGMHDHLCKWWSTDAVPASGASPPPRHACATRTCGEARVHAQQASQEPDRHRARAAAVSGCGHDLRRCNCKLLPAADQAKRLRGL